MIGSALSLSLIGHSQDLTTARHLTRNSTINIPTRLIPSESVAPSETDNTSRLNVLDDHTAMDAGFLSVTPNTPAVNRLLHEPIEEEDEEREDDDQSYSRYLIRMNHLYTAYARAFPKALLITSLNPRKKQSNDLTNSQNTRNNTWITFLQPIWTSEVNINYICKRDKFQKAFVFIPN
ncbi:unnamed protein product [Schistosoma mattheei]|uniref:Uncharacterized protein n=1 Tax=Schistosoma mattheei TaxID=31246 RepID=A0A183NFX3_9TREM|nr:unnamed protein product [Schistosoma mattheei]